MAGASAQYVVDVAVSMPEGQQTAAELDSLSASLLQAGVTSDNFHDAIAQAANALSEAKAATLSANASLAAGNVAYGDLERSALQASKAQEKAAKLGVVPPEIAAQADAAARAVNDYSIGLAKLENEAKTAAADEARLAQQLSQVQRVAAVGSKALAQQAAETKGSTSAVNELNEGLAKLGGPLGSIGRLVLGPVSGFKKMAGSIGDSNAQALLAVGAFAAVAAAVAVVTVALVAGTLAIAAWGVGLADSARSAGLNQAALAQLNPAYGAVSGQLEDLTHDTGLSREALNGLTKSLIAAKVSAKDMPEALQAAATAEAALGNGGAQQFIDQIKAGTLTVDKFASNAQSKFGGIVAQQMRGLTAQTALLKTSIGQVFGGLNIDPVLNGMQRLVALFDTNNAAGAAMKTIFEGLFQPLIDSADKASVYVEAFVLGFLIGLTKLYIQVKPAIKTVREFFGVNDSGLSDTLASVTKFAEYLVPAFVAIAAVLGVVAIATVGTIAAVIAIQVAIYALIAAVVTGAVSLVEGFVNGWNRVTAFLDGIVPGLGQVGVQIMQGLANGISSAAGLPLQAITGAVGGAISGAKNLLGIASPSKVFAEIGVNTTEGYAGGVDAGADDAQQSVMAALAPPAPSALAAQGQAPLSAFGAAGAGSGSATPGAAASSGGKSVTISGPVNFYGVEGAEDAFSRFSEFLTRALEGDATALGYTPEPA